MSTEQLTRTDYISCSYKQRITFLFLRILIIITTTGYTRRKCWLEATRCLMFVPFIDIRFFSRSICFGQYVTYL
jgi:hypothetical protein